MFLQIKVCRIEAKTLVGCISKTFRTYIDMNLFPWFCKGKSLLKFVQAFSKHPLCVYRQDVSKMHMYVYA